MAVACFAIFVALAAFAPPARANLVTVNRDAFLYRLTQSITGLTLWTAPNTMRIKSTDTTAPTATGSRLSISSAREELESFQVIVGPTNQYSSVTVTMDMFPNLGVAAEIDVGKADFVAASAWAQGTVSVRQGRCWLMMVGNDNDDSD